MQEEMINDYSISIAPFKVENSYQLIDSSR